MSKIRRLIDNPIFKSILTPQVKKLVKIFTDEGHEIRLAGGAVRDLLRGIRPSDLDFATTATPQQSLDLLHSHSIRTINALGLRHGTVTARIDLGTEDTAVQFEVTTLRIDTDTDGRHANVEYTTDWQLDANRRDLTINAMFLDVNDGTIYDYFDGESDLRNRRIAFVGDAGYRIREDYLRIMRYFRFYGKISDDPNRHEESIIREIRQNVQGLQNISGERIWMEWKKILTGRFGGELTLKMIEECDLGPYIGLPENPCIERFNKTWKNSKNEDDHRSILHPITLLTSLLRNENEMLKLHARLKLSGFERDLGLFILRHRDFDGTEIRFYQWMIIDNSMKVKLSDCKFYVSETLLLKGLKIWSQEIQDWQVPKLPVNGHDLIQQGCPKGRIMSIVMKKLTDIWKRSDFTLKKQDLLDKLGGILDDESLQLSSPKSKKKCKTEDRKKS